MSLLLDALKRAEEAKRAKAEASATAPTEVGATPESDAVAAKAPNESPIPHGQAYEAARDDAANKTVSPPSATGLPATSLWASAVASSQDDPFPHLSLEEINPTADDAVTQGSHNPAAIQLPKSAARTATPIADRKRDVTAIRPLELIDTPSPILPHRPHDASAAEALAGSLLAERLQEELSAEQRMPTKTGAAAPAATAAFRAARSAQLQRSSTGGAAIGAEALSLKAAEPAPSADALRVSHTGAADMEELAVSATVAPAELKQTVVVTPSAASGKLPDTTAKQAQRESAKNVFDAKNTPKASTKARFILPVVVLLVTTSMLGAWYVWREAKRIARPQLAKSPTSSPAEPAPAKSNPLAAASSPSSLSSPPTGVMTTPTAAATAQTSAEVLPPLLPPLATKVEAARLPNAAKGYSFTPREELVQRIEALPTPPATGVRFQAASPARPLTIAPALVAGYAALSSGDYPAAKQRYAEAIAADTTSIDANLGFATAAARSGDVSLAERHYRRVLEIDPRNATAAAALVALTGAGAADTIASRENALRQLLAQDPTVAASHFALGNVYAEDRRWRDAQQAYFDAVRLAPQNADYLYNLAVSLDHLGQVNMAHDFYQKALVAKGSAQFDRAAVEDRIRSIVQRNNVQAGSDAPSPR
jgi:Tfp pilus assembly protein PilF